jgi:hypothetical protein
MNNTNLYIAYASAMKGNSTMARHYINEYQKVFGDYGLDEEEQQHLASV